MIKYMNIKINSKINVELEGLSKSFRAKYKTELVASNRITTITYEGEEDLEKIYVKLISKW